MHDSFDAEVVIDENILVTSHTVESRYIGGGERQREGQLQRLEVFFFSFFKNITINILFLNNSYTEKKLFSLSLSLTHTHMHTQIITVL